MAEHTVTPWVELAVIRKKDGHTPTTLARASGLSLSYVCDLESGRRKPNPRVLKLFAQVLNVPVSVLEPGTTATPAEAGAA